MLARNFAKRILKAVVRRAPTEVREWGLAMLGEMDFIESDWGALSWAFGSVQSLVKKGVAMRRQPINKFSGRAAITLSLIALFTVVTGFFQAPQADEGTAAHIFQLSIAALLPTILIYLVSANWEEPLRSLRRLALPAATLVVAFSALYYLEHYYYLQQLK